MSVRLAASTYSHLWTHSLEEALGELAGAGYDSAEVMVTVPHLDVWEEGLRRVAEVRAAAERAGVGIDSVVPPGLDINLASPDAAMRDWSLRHYLTVGRIGAALGATAMVVHPGRRHPFKPAPYDDARQWVVESLAAIATGLEPEGVRPVFENTPSNIIDTAEECCSVVEEVGEQRVGLVYDVPNGFMVEDPSHGLRVSGACLELVHISDATASKWAHDPVGAGEVDWAAVWSTLDDLGYEGRAVVETRHHGAVGDGLRADREALERAGWRVTRGVPA